MDLLSPHPGHVEAPVSDRVGREWNGGPGAGRAHTPRKGCGDAGSGAGGLYRTSSRSLGARQTCGPTPSRSRRQKGGGDAGPAPYHFARNPVRRKHPHNHADPAGRRPYASHPGRPPLSHHRARECRATNSVLA